MVVSLASGTLHLHRDMDRKHDAVLEIDFPLRMTRGHALVQFVDSRLADFNLAGVFVKNLLVPVLVHIAGGILDQVRQVK